MMAERDTTDRYLAAFLADRVGTELFGRVSGIQKFGVFVKLDETGADGLIPVRSIGGEYFHYDRDAQTLQGAETGVMIGLGQPVTVRLSEAAPVTGGLILELIELNGKVLPQAPKQSRKGPVKRKARRAAGKKRKVTRRRK